MEKKALTLGVDIGGTKVAAGLVDSRGTVLRSARVPMVANQDAAAGFAAVKSAIEKILATEHDSREQVVGIGVCSPGPLDPRTGIVINPPNLPCWRNFPLAAELELAFGVTARVDNDANAAGLAEALWGSAVGYQNVFYATIGTGIGTGIVFNNRIYHGRTGSAAEGGHISIDYRGPVCNCGKRGCIEILCSGPAIAQRARSALAETERPSRLRELAKADPAQLSAEHVGEAFRAGDTIATEILTKNAELITVWLGNVIDLLEPDVIVIGGGAAELVQPFFGRIKEWLPKWSINPRSTEIPLVPAKYGTDAGIAGAATLCLSR